MTVPLHQGSVRVAAVCTLVLAACTSHEPAAGPAPRPSGGPPPREWTAESSGAEIAAWIQQGCRSDDPCIERALAGVLGQAGIAKSMEALDSLVLRDPRVRNSGHALAHGLGISAYRGAETVAATFAGCPTSQMSGCFHGVIQGYFLDLARQGRPIGGAELDALCAPHLDGPRFVLHHCGHGTGHGLMAAHDNHLPAALASCDLLSDAFTRESCYTGAFMENGVQVTHPHHTASGHAQTQGGGHAHGGHASSPDDAHAGHGGHHADAQGMVRGEWRALDRDDPLYPCNVVDEKYRQACYGYQPSPLMFFNGGDVVATARVCQTVPEAFVDACFGSLGREITTWASQEHERTARMCAGVAEVAAGRAGALCVRGAVETLVQQSADPQNGLRFCRVVSGAEPREECYDRVGTFMVTLYADAEERARHCAAAEPEFVAVCRRGAEVDRSERRDGA
ncbi:MAG TPA: hypothetical protein VHG93_26135 [Longimicrobium sp.]|nr:hypothetical protein [Longimicrobium sp.]